jgi:hypothetical protein
MPLANLPKLLKHTTVAVYNNLKVADPKDRFSQAFTIARAQLMKYGYLSAGSDVGPVSKIHLTAKGVKREAKHGREPGGYAKSTTFDRMYRWIETSEPPQTPKPKGVDKPLPKRPPKGQTLKMASRKLPFK